MAETTKTPNAFGGAEEVDGLLVRYLDGELSGSDGGEARALLESSPEARERLAELRSGSDLFSNRLGDLLRPEVPAFSVPEISVPEVPKPDASGRGGRGKRSRSTLSTFVLHHRLAAGIVLVLLTVSFLAPVRAWIVEGIRTVASIVAPSEELPETVTGVGAGPSAVSFVPLGDELVVSVEGYQASGRLSVIVVEGSRASGEASIQEAGVELLVLPHGIEVRNGPGSMADYIIGVPRTLQRVRVLVGGRELEVVNPGEVVVGNTWAFELSDTGG